MSKTLLLADDSVVIQKLVGLSFANEDVEIVSTDNGDDALIRAREVRPDVVLADVVMPGKSGYEVCEAIKQDATLAHVPVLLLTGTFEAFDEARATSVGADGHITKPFEAQALVERVKTVMRSAARPAPAPRADASTAAPIEGLFDDDALVVEGDEDRDGFLGQTDSLDVTPSISEDDLSEALDDDLFGPAGDDIGESSMASKPAPLDLETDSNASAEVDGVGECDDQTIAIPLPTEAVAPSLARVDAPSDADTRVLGGDALDEDLGFDEPLDLGGLDSRPVLDLDSAFDPEPASQIQVARDDANAATSRSLPTSGVTDLDALLATSAPSLAPASARGSAPPSAAAPRAMVPDPAARMEPPPPPLPHRDFGVGSASSAREPDYGFDVSEQAPVAKVDLLEESFSSLLDVSESQVLGDPSVSIPSPAPVPSSARAVPELPVDDFDVSSGDLLAREESPSPTASPVESALQPPPLPPPAVSAGPAIEALPVVSLDAGEPPDEDVLPDSGDSGASGGSAGLTTPPFSIRSDSDAAASRQAVDDLSPVLQQRVHETLEKVAWEAFSDLSETIVKQVIERVERIAWEVIPQMAETLVREEIRKLKGESD
ncbi:MAG: response regulator [Myxococcota bacterium]